MTEPIARWAEKPAMTPEEWAVVLEVCRGKRVFEFGSGGSTVELAKVCESLTTVEHQAEWAMGAILKAPTVRVLYVPPDEPYAEGAEDDGSPTAFASYVDTFAFAVTNGVDVVLIDGRARVACATTVRLFPLGAKPIVLLHDCDRPQYAPIFEMFREVRRVGSLAVLEAK